MLTLGLGPSHGGRGHAALPHTPIVMLKQALSTAGGALRSAVLTRVNLAPTTPFTLQVRVCTLSSPASHPLLYIPPTPCAPGEAGAARRLPESDVSPQPSD